MQSESTKSRVWHIKAFQMLSLSAFREFTIYLKNNLEFKKMGSNSGFAMQVLYALTRLVSQSNQMMISIPKNGSEEK